MSASRVKASCRASASAVMTSPLPAVASVSSSASALPSPSTENTSTSTSPSATPAVTSSSRVSLVSRPSDSTSRVRWPSVPAMSTASSTPSYSRVSLLRVSPSITSRAASRSVVGSRARVTSLANVTMPTCTSSGTVSRKVEAAAFAAWKRSPCIELLVSMTRMAVRSIDVLESARAAVADAWVPSTVTLTLAEVDLGVLGDRHEQLQALGGGLHVRDRRLAGLAGQLVRRVARGRGDEQQGQCEEQAPEQEDDRARHQIRSVANRSGSTVTLA